MELWQLEVLLTVADENGFSRAGDKLGRTQPAISAAIKHLEDEIGEPLFDRLGKSIQLTAAGEVLSEYARRLLRIRDEAIQAVGDLRGLSRGSLSLGANETTCLYLLPEVLSAFKSEYPLVQIEIHRGISRSITEKVIAGGLDFGIVTMPVSDPKLEVVTVHGDEMALIVAPSHRFARSRSVSTHELENEPFILHEVGTTTRERIIKHFSDRGVRIKVSMELSSIETIKRFVAIEMGISIVPRLCIAKELQEGSLHALRIKGTRFQRRLGLVYSKHRYRSQAARTFLAIVRRTIPQPSTG